MLDRVSRAMIAAAIIPRVTAGRTRWCRSPPPVAGNHARCSEKTKIESLATLQRDQLLAEARREAASIRGQAEAKAIEISNAAHRKDPEFYELLKTLETYESILDDQTTVVLSADSPLLKLLTRAGLRTSRDRTLFA